MRESHWFGSSILRLARLRFTAATARLTCFASDGELSGEDVRSLPPAISRRCGTGTMANDLPPRRPQANRKQDEIEPPKQGWWRCAESSVTPEVIRPRRSWWRGCGGSSIAATTARGWRRSTADRLVRAQAGRPGAGARGVARPRAGAGHLRDQPHALGDSRAGHRPQRPSPSGRAGRARSRSPSCTTASSKTTPRCARELESQGFAFVSQTDTEVIAHLIARELETADDLFEAVQRALPRLEGTYGLAVVSPKRPGEVIGARFGSPLVVGLGEGEHLLASDPVAIAPHTARVAFLQDGEVVRLMDRDFEIRHLEHGPITPRIDRIDWKPDAVELGGHAHYMIKEIREQPETVINACRGRLRRAEATAQFGGLNLSARQLRRVRRVVLAACGTSWHAALVGEYLIERLAHLPVEVEYASEFRYRNAPLDDRTLVFVLSQSGETADTLGALHEAKRRGHPTLAIVNTVGSTIAREADGGIYLHAGPEVGVASTKAFSAQVTVLLLLALYLGRLRQLSFPDGLAVVNAIESVPGLLGEVLKTEPLIEQAADRFTRRRERPLSRSRPSLSGRARGRAQAQGDQLHPRRGLSDRRDETRADRAGRRRDAVRLRGAARLAARQDAQQPRGGQGPQRHDHRRRHRRRPALWPHCPTSSCRSPMPPRSSSRSWPSCRCSCWRITSRGGAAAISTSRATWPRA